MKFDITKKIGMILLSIWLILMGLALFIPAIEELDKSCRSWPLLLVFSSSCIVNLPCQPLNPSIGRLDFNSSHQ